MIRMLLNNLFTNMLIFLLINLIIVYPHFYSY
ncbi:Hypothetical protein FNO222_1916 [Francisella orientalis]|uniref:Uncharacterized protein n=1 Tax=Francisella orientalis TaxID=299583 RepID=A0ABM5U8B0_9GAMM|nr:hypothetical protein FNO12_1901 [Francisella orientalis FNO12]AKN87903.1 Hypothetical protein FNO24_1903 [Francisella orientalis FNO24]AKN89442.1 Hypothetical protein FNO190_1901 [Francisella orientalis]AKU06201.1 Hypothetical protein FNO01_1901 [Francisella orientalis]QEN21118.1 Hypothetical protein FNO39_1916 [Francisella orientalis]